MCIILSLFPRVTTAAPVRTKAFQENTYETGTFILENVHTLSTDVTRAVAEILAQVLMFFTQWSIIFCVGEQPTAIDARSYDITLVYYRRVRVL